MTERPVAKKVAKRYSADEKQEILAFIARHNDVNNRGGRSAAAREYGVSPITLKAWTMSDGFSCSSEPASLSELSIRSDGYCSRIEEMAILAGQIESAEAELAELKSRLRTEIGEIDI